MKAVLIDERIYITNIYGALCRSNETIELDLQHIKDPHLYKFDVAFNNYDFVKVYSNKIVIPTFKEQQEYVIIKVRMTNMATNVSTMFMSDEIPLAKYYYFGKPIEDMYPQLLGTMLIRINKLEKEVKDLKEKGDIL